MTRQQLNLFDQVPAPICRSAPATPFVRDSLTSREAAERIRPVVGRIARRVLGFIVTHAEHGATDEEIRNALELSADTSRARRVELVASGQVRDSGNRRPSSSGRAMAVWVATAAGITTHGAQERGPEGS